MNKKIIIPVVVIAVLVLIWYGYNNWGWFGGTKKTTTGAGRIGSTINPIGNPQIDSDYKRLLNNNVEIINNSVHIDGHNMADTYIKTLILSVISYSNLNTNTILNYPIPYYPNSTTDVFFNYNKIIGYAKQVSNYSKISSIQSWANTIADLAVKNLNILGYPIQPQ